MGLLTDLISKVGLDTRDLEKDLDRTHRKFVRSGRRMSLIGNDLTNNISLPLLAIGGFAIKSAADIQRLELALKNTMGAGYIDELEKLKKIAKDPGLGFEQAVRGSVALQAVGNSADYAREMMQVWGNAVAAAGGTAENLDRVVVQLQQALSKQGSLLREDWKFIIEKAPQAQKAMMKIYGTGSTEELAKQGFTAKQIIAAITDELSKLGKVEGGIANKFINFRDELKQTLAPLGKMIFESSDLKEVMAAMVGTVTWLGKVFGKLSPAIQGLLVKFAAGLIILGPFMRIMGSGRLIGSQLYNTIGKLGIRMRNFTGIIMGARKRVLLFTTALRGMSAAAMAVAGILGEIALVAAGLYLARQGDKWTAELLGSMAATDPDSFWVKIFGSRTFAKYGFRAGDEWTKGFEEGLAKNERALKRGMEAWASLDFNLWGIGATEPQPLPPFVVWFQEHGKDAVKETNAWAEALRDLKEELRGITEMEKLFPTGNQKYAEYDAIIATMTYGITELGKSADDPGIIKLKNRLQEIHGEFQGIVKKLPTLNLIPKSLSDLGIEPPESAPLQPVELDKRQMGLGAARSLNRGYADGLITYGEASKKLTDDFGLGLGRELMRGLDNGMVLQGPELLDNLEQLMVDAKMTLSGGLAEVAGSIIGGENPMKALIEGLLLPMTDILKRFGELVIAAGTLREAVDDLGLTGIPAIIAGGAMIAIATASKSFLQNKLTSLREGGIAMKPTPALVGDNPRSPEAIIPLHKLDSMLNKGGNAIVRIMGNFDIQGDKLTYFIDEQVDLRKSLSMY